MKLVTSVVALCIVVGFTAGSPVRATDVRPCPAQPLTVGELLALADDAGYAGFLGQLNPAGLACFGGSDVRVIGFVDEPEGLGGVSAVVIEPRWLTERGLFLHPSSAGTSDASGAFYAVRTRPVPATRTGATRAAGCPWSPTSTIRRRRRATRRDRPTRTHPPKKRRSRCAARSSCCPRSA